MYGREINEFISSKPNPEVVIAVYKISVLGADPFQSQKNSP